MLPPTRAPILQSTASIVASAQPIQDAADNQICDMSVGLASEIQKVNGNRYRWMAVVLQGHDLRLW